MDFSLLMEPRKGNASLSSWIVWLTLIVCLTKPCSSQNSDELTNLFKLVRDAKTVRIEGTLDSWMELNPGRAPMIEAITDQKEIIFSIANTFSQNQWVKLTEKNDPAQFSTASSIFDLLVTNAEGIETSFTVLAGYSIWFEKSQWEMTDESNRDIVGELAALIHSNQQDWIIKDISLEDYKKELRRLRGETKSGTK
jgi:hypothetical protein